MILLLPSRVDCLSSTCLSWYRMHQMDVLSVFWPLRIVVQAR